MNFHIGDRVQITGTIGPVRAGEIGTVIANPRTDGIYIVSFGGKELATTGIHLELVERLLTEA